LEDEPIVNVTIASVRQVTGKNPETGSKGASTDISHLFHLVGTSTVIFDPWNPDLFNKIDEYASIENLLLSGERLILVSNDLFN
jgi:acetylornithine deacetylase/succinyl-diaminopimelate desuccinylase-like protein